MYGYPENDTQGIGLRISGLFESKAEVAALCRQVLPAYQQPSQIELVERMDLGVTGKKRRV